MKGMLDCLGIVLFSSRLIIASDIINVNCSEGVIMGKYGSSVVLPCWISPVINAETLEIRWYRPEQFNTPILFYQNHKTRSDFLANYINRTSLTSRNPQSTGLKQGDISLRLDNLGLIDTGIFHCYVSGDQSYHSNSVKLNITALGSPPLLSLKHHDDSMNLSCSSCGWFPRPSLLWKSTNKKDDLQSPIYSNQKNGLFCVQSWVILSSSVSNSISCSVRLSEYEKTEVTVDLGALKGDNNGVWKILCILLLLFVLALVGIAVFLYRKYKPGYTPVKKDEQLNDVAQTDTIIEDLRKSAVTITFDMTDCKKDCLMFNREGLSVRDEQEAAKKYEGQGFPYALCVHGKNTFQSGRVYWEVGLKSVNVRAKKSWLIGVAKASYTIDDKSYFTPSNGFWFLYSNKENGLRVNTEPEISLQINTMPECIGVLLDFDKGELSFYSVPKGERLFTLITKFEGEIVPLFNPGIGDAGPLLLINPQVKNQVTNPTSAQTSNKV